MDVLALFTDGYCSILPPPVPIVYLGTAQTDDEQQEALQELLIEGPSPSGEILGIHQSDLIFRTAILAGIAQLRANTTLLDYVFASLLSDPTTKLEYRQKQIKAATEWFLHTKIPVLMYPRQDQIEFPCITIALRESQEVDRESTTADTHNTPEQDIPGYTVLIPQFEPKSYDLKSGTITLPLALQPYNTSPAMIVFDRAGQQFPVVALTDPDGETIGNGTTIQIAPGSSGDFTRITLNGPSGGSSITLESASFKETYTVGCHIQGEPAYLTYLHSIMVFILLRYREELLEARGFERSTVSSAEFIPDAQYFETKENVFSRYVSVTGFVRQYWPKFTFPKALNVTTVLKVVGSNKVPGGPTGRLWIGDKDSVG